MHCSRERSRVAWQIIEEVWPKYNFGLLLCQFFLISLFDISAVLLMMQYLMPFVDQEEYQLPSKCRLHPDNDMFREQEQHKVHVDTNEWRCGLCKKSFRAEKFLDQHFDNRHYVLLNNVSFTFNLQCKIYFCFSCFRLITNALILNLIPYWWEF